MGFMQQKCSLSIVSLLVQSWGHRFVQRSSANMRFAIEIVNPRWNKVFTVPFGAALPKGKRDMSKSILHAAKSITDSFGCYSWASNDEVYYCGSFSEYANFTSNFEGRIYQYLTNHRRAEDGSPSNTNARIFDLLNEALRISDVTLQLLRFDHLKCSDAVYEFDTFAADSDLTKAVERLLIATYTRMGQCEWNDT